MKRIYVTTIPLQGRLDLAKNTYRSSANSGDIETASRSCRSCTTPCRKATISTSSPSAV